LALGGWKGWQHCNVITVAGQVHTLSGSAYAPNALPEEREAWSVPLFPTPLCTAPGALHN